MWNTKEIQNSVKVATNLARNISDELYGYYLRLRGPAPGAMPDGSVATLTYDQRTWHEIICENVLGWVCYTRPLTPEEVDQYELVPDEYNSYPEYGVYIVEVKELARDASGRKQLTTRFVENEDGTGRFITPYRGVAQKIANAINDAALDTNTKDHLTRATARLL